MTVKEVKGQIEKLECDYRNMIKLQDYFMGHTKSTEETVSATRTEIEDGANLSRPVRDLCSSVAKMLSDEIKRLNNIIDNAVVNTK